MKAVPVLVGGVFGRIRSCWSRGEKLGDFSGFASISPYGLIDFVRIWEYIPLSLLPGPLGNISSLMDTA
jgi:hypothetical protein